jgi:MYXO-CTERM domain-containing protein
MRDRTSPGARLALVGVGVVALLAIVGLASRGGLGGGGSRGPAPSGSLLDYGFTIFLVLYVLMIPFAIWGYLLQGRQRRLASGGRQGRGLLSNLAVFVAMTGAAVAIVAMRHARTDQPLIKLPQPVSPTGGKQRPAATDAGPQFQWTVVIAAAALGAAGVGAYLVRRRRPSLRDAPALTEALAFALDDAIDDVRAETDPRRAVIKAYARMEQILGAYGLPRGPSEAPYEYLARTLQTLDASAAAVARLTDLFERAKFSLHEIGEEMRDDAIGALTAVRDELREAA